MSDPVYWEEIRAFVDERYPVEYPNMAARYSVHFCKSDGPARVLNGSD